MFPLLTVYLMLCLVSISGKVRAKQLPPKPWNEFIISSFFLSIFPMAACTFREKWEAGVWNQGIFRKIFYVISKSYVEIILEDMISGEFFFTTMTKWNWCLTIQLQKKLNIIYLGNLYNVKYNISSFLV